MFPRKKRRTDPHSPAHFDLVVVGCGGGHDETNLSGYVRLIPILLPLTGSQLPLEVSRPVLGRRHPWS